MSNDFFSKLNGLDLQQLLYEIDNTLIEYRDTLNLPMYLTFGTELEYEGIKEKSVSKFIKKYDEWKSKKDLSIDVGGEIISPIMYDDIKYWNELKEICKYLKKKNVDTSKNAGGHIHIGANVLGSEMNNWLTLIKLYTIYERILFRFAYGDKLSKREVLMDFASPSSYDLYKILDKIEKTSNVCDLYMFLHSKNKNDSINFNNVDFYNADKLWDMNTIEFRFPNASSNEIIWQNNINTLSKMLLSCKMNVIDIDFLNYKLDKEYSKDIYLYNEIILKDALEFVYIIFDNNLDKIYFLIQYLKRFQDNYNLKFAVKCKKITR